MKSNFFHQPLYVEQSTVGIKGQSNHDAMVSQRGWDKVSCMTETTEAADSKPTAVGGPGSAVKGLRHGIWGGHHAR